jgi:hypothetical protein
MYIHGDLHESSHLPIIFCMTNDGARQHIVVMVILYPKGYTASQFIQAITDTFTCSYIILR